MKKRFDLRRYVTLAMFSALAFASLFVFRISGIGGFLTFDVKDAIITISAMLFGPISGVVIALLVSLLEMITVSGTGPWGFLMNFASTAAFAAVGSAVYRYMPRLKRTLSGAVIGLTGSVVVTTGIMLLMNLWVTPIYYNVPLSVVKDMMLPLLMPFNLIKTVLNAALVLVLYKPLSFALKRAKVIPGKSDESFNFDKKSIILTVVGVAVVVACIVLLIVALNGHFEWIKKTE